MSNCYVPYFDISLFLPVCCKFGNLLYPWANIFQSQYCLTLNSRISSLWILLIYNYCYKAETESYITTVSQSASLSWNKAPVWGLRPDFYYCQTVAGLLFVAVGRSLWREDGSVIYSSSWISLAQSFSGPTPVGFVTIFYCLGFETYLFVPSYDSHGYGWGIRARLHKGQYISVSSFGAGNYLYKIKDKAVPVLN
jgi:hypothetical protein